MQNMPWHERPIVRKVVLEDPMISLLFTAALAQTPPVAAEMHERFQLSMQARDHVIQGQLDEAKALAKQLRGVGSMPGAPAAWKPQLDALDTAATALSEASDVGAAAKAVATLGSVCGQCHGDTEGGPGLEGMRGVPPQKWSEGDNMPLHLWSVDWMWLGLIAPSSTAWQRGADELDAKPLATMFGNDEKTAKQLETQVYALAKKATALGDDAHADRAKVMGELLGTCATCHVLRDQAAPKEP